MADIVPSSSTCTPLWELSDLCDNQHSYNGPISCDGIDLAHFGWSDARQHTLSEKATGKNGLNQITRPPNHTHNSKRLEHSLKLHRTRLVPMAPIISVIAAGIMGGGVAQKLTESGATVLTHLQGRSEQTRKRAHEAKMEDAPLKGIVQRSDFILSILPPRDAFALAQRMAQEVALHPREMGRPLIYADCNAVNVATVERIAQLLRGTSVTFVDACIIGGPPKGSSNPTFYASANPGDEEALESFVNLSSWGLCTKALDGNIGAASALKMSYTGISKGLTGLMATMILAAHASSPATAEALIAELINSQPELLRRCTTHVPPMVPKAYRWVGEMQEVARFVGEGEGEIYQGLAKLYGRIESSVSGDGKDIEILEQFVGAAKKALQGV